MAREIIGREIVGRGGSGNRRDYLVSEEGREGRAVDGIGNYKLLAVEMISLAVNDLRDADSEGGEEGSGSGTGVLGVRAIRKKVNKEDYGPMQQDAREAARWLLGMGEAALGADIVCELIGIDREVVARKVHAERVLLQSCEAVAKAKFERNMEKRREKLEARGFQVDMGD